MTTTAYDITAYDKGGNTMTRWQDNTYANTVYRKDDDNVSTNDNTPMTSDDDHVLISKFKWWHVIWYLFHMMLPFIALASVLTIVLLLADAATSHGSHPWPYAWVLINLSSSSSLPSSGGGFALHRCVECFRLLGPHSTHRHSYLWVVDMLSMR